MLPVVFGIFGLGPMEMLIIGAIAVLLFGSRLPEVARSLGKGMLEFKRGMQGIEEEVNLASTRRTTSTSYHEIDDREEATAPKFEPPTAEPQIDGRNEDAATV